MLDCRASVRITPEVDGSVGCSHADAGRRSQKTVARYQVEAPK
jgi:hypothetical protein